MFKKLIIAFLVLGFLLAIAPIHLQRAVIRNFSNVKDYRFFDNAVVKAGEPQPWAIAKEQALLSDTMLSQLVENKTLAFLIMQDDTIQYEFYDRGFDENSYSGSFSMAKSVVSMLMGIAVEEGKVNSIKDPIADYIEAFRRPGTDSIRIIDLLTMSGGFNWKESYSNPLSKTTKAYYGNDLKGLMASLEAARPSGQLHEYSSNETQILSWVIEEAYGRPIYELFSEKIWQQIGAEQDALWSLDREGGVARAFCCINSNARDFARLGKLVLNNGLWDSTALVPSDYLEEATSPASWLVNADGEEVDYYGYQFWIVQHRGLQIPYFRGVLGQFIFILPEHNAVVVRLGEYVSRKRIHHTPPDVFTYLDAALEVLEGSPEAQLQD